MLRPQDVGYRVVVRRVAESRAGRTLYTDAIGELVELTETDLTLATPTGRLRVPLSAVHRAKRVPPPRRPTAAAMIELELAADEGWPAPVHERLGEWVLRAADGWTGRANSALAVGDPGRPLPDAIDEVQRWYAARGQPALITVPLPLARPVSAELDARGWGARPTVLAQTASIADILAATDTDRSHLPPVELATAPSDGWLALVARRKNGLPDAARHVLTAVDQVRFAHVYAPQPVSPNGSGSPEPGSGSPALDSASPEADHGSPELVGIARGTITGHRRWLGLTLVEVLPAARRQGLAQHMIRALAEWASSLGVTNAYLHVVGDNVAATALYRKLGFRTHHTYETRIAPTG